MAMTTAAAPIAMISTSSAPATESGPSRAVRRLATSVEPRASSATAQAMRLNHMAGCRPATFGNLMSRSRNAPHSRSKLSLHRPTNAIMPNSSTSPGTATIARRADRVCSVRRAAAIRTMPPTPGRRGAPSARPAGRKLRSGMTKATPIASRQMSTPPTSRGLLSPASAIKPLSRLPVSVPTRPSWVARR